MKIPKLTNKALINISLLLSLPLLMSTLMLCMISFEWYLTGGNKFANLFLTGEFNRGFSCILFGSGLFSISMIIPTLLMVSRHANNIDRLEQAEIEANEEKVKYRRAAEKFANQQ